MSNDACHQPVALLFAGSSSTTIGNPIGEVLTKVGTALGESVSFVGTTCGTALTAQADFSALPEDAIARATVIKGRHEARLFARPSVIGVGVGASDSNPSEAVIVVYVDQTTGIEPSLPRRINGVRVKRVYTDPIIAY